MKTTVDILNMSVGQTDLHPSIRNILLEPLETPTYFKDYKDLELETIDLLKRLINAENVFILLGTGRTGLEAGIYNIISPGDKVICLDNGQWGNFFGKLAESQEANVSYIKSGLGDELDYKALENQLQNEKDIKAILMTQCETSTGVLNSIEIVASLIKQYSSGTLLMVDGISAFGGVEVNCVENNIDFYCGGSQKCLNAPQGTPIIALSDRALNVTTNNENNKFLHTLTLTNKASFILTKGLNSVVKEIFREGENNTYERHTLMAKSVRKGLEAMGLNVLAVTDAIASPTCTRIAFPSDIQKEIDTERKKNGIDQDRVTQHMKNNYHVVIAEDRIGTMGYFANHQNIIRVLYALEQTLFDLYNINTQGKGVLEALKVLNQNKGLKEYSF